MAQTFSGTATTSETQLNLGTRCTGLYVENTGSNDLRVKVTGLHSDDFDTIGPGQYQPYEAGSIPGAVVKTDSGTTTYRAGVIKA